MLYITNMYSLVKQQIWDFHNEFVSWSMYFLGVINLKLSLTPLYIQYLFSSVL